MKNGFFFFFFFCAGNKFAAYKLEINFSGKSLKNNPKEVILSKAELKLHFDYLYIVLYGTKIKFRSNSKLLARKIT